MPVKERIRINMNKLIAIILTGIMVMSFAACAGQSGNNGLKHDPAFESVTSANEALELSKKSSVVVMEDGICTSGKEVWDEFYKDVQNKKSACVVCAAYYTLDDENISEELYEQEKGEYPVLFYTLVEYNGKEFSVKVRQSDKSEMERTETFKALSYFKGDMREGAKYSTYERYVLVNDASLKWEDIDRGMFSSQSDAWIEHIVLYQTYK